MRNSSAASRWLVLSVSGGRDDEQVEPGAEEGVQIGLGGAREPLGRELALRVAEAGGRVAVVALGLGRRARVQGVGVHLEAESGGYAGGLAADAAVAEDASGDEG